MRRFRKSPLNRDDTERRRMQRSHLPGIRSGEKSGDVAENGRGEQRAHPSAKRKPRTSLSPFQSDSTRPPNLFSTQLGTPVPMRHQRRQRRLTNFTTSYIHHHQRPPSLLRRCHSSAEVRNGVGLGYRSRLRECST
ncbi:hypothetical protein BDQ17DRAFT_271721 [Cyathus striatus]|nr:hypothetical protein BDQ17DRAFT_271721 [Cyathus striatus]